MNFTLGAKTAFRLMLKRPVRTRFAPSPTGYLHVGGARTALFNYLYAKAKGGKYILRVEDTDQARSSSESEEQVLDSLRWLGLMWDEGPDCPGEVGPYRQSERLDIFTKKANWLIENKKAYYCFCTTDELEAKKKRMEAMGLPPIYDGKCRGLSDEEVQEKLGQKTRHTVRFHTPKEEIVVKDMVQKEVHFDSSLIGDFIIVKSDGFPSYNFAVVVDDYLMEISHVIRGVGHLSNTPRQIVIYNAFDWQQPEWAHVSEIVGSDHKKLSKRHGATAVTAFRDLGYSSEAFVNYMALLGWSSPDGNETMSTAEIIEKFDVARCSKSPSMFDVFDLSKSGDVDLNELAALDLEPYLFIKSKLNHISNLKIRQRKDEDYLNEILPFVKQTNLLTEIECNLENDRLKATLLALRIYLDYYYQIKEHIKDFFVDFSSSDLSESAKEWLGKNPAKALTQSFIDKITSLDDWQVKPTIEENKAIEGQLKIFIKESGKEVSVKGKDLFMTLRAAVTGKTVGLELPVFIILLGKERVLARLQTTLSFINK